MVLKYIITDFLYHKMIRKNNFVITILYWLWLQKVEPVSSHNGNVSNENMNQMSILMLR